MTARICCNNAIYINIIEGSYGLYACTTKCTKMENMKILSGLLFLLNISLMTEFICKTNERTGRSADLLKKKKINKQTAQYNTIWEYIGKGC